MDETKPCKIIVRKIFHGDDYNRVVSMDGAIPVECEIEVILAYSILDKKQIDTLVAAGVQIQFEDLRDIPTRLTHPLGYF